MAETQANRMAGGFAVRLAVQSGNGPGAGTPAFPDLSAEPVVWTNFPYIPGVSEEVKIVGDYAFEDFMPAKLIHKVGADLVGAGVDKITIPVKETDLAAMNLALRGGLLNEEEAGVGDAGYWELDQPIQNTDFPLHQIVLEAFGPKGGFGQLIWFPFCQRIIENDGIITTGPKRIRTMTYSFSVFAALDSTLIPEGACWKAFQYEEAALAE